jgi:hypothetical protein
VRDQLERRLEQLKAEAESGQKTLAAIDARRAELHATLLRISGAILVLEEELAKDATDESGETVDTDAKM